MKITQPQKITRIPIFFNKNSLTLKNLHKKYYTRKNPKSNRISLMDIDKTNK